MGLRFCMLTTFYPPYNFGGDGIGIQRLSEALARRGHEVTVVHEVDAFRSLHSGAEPERGPLPEGLEVIGLESRLGTLSPLMVQQLGRPLMHRRRLRALLEEGDFDVINFHNISLVGGPGLLAYGDAVKLYMAHEHWLVCPSHVLWRHGRERCDEKQCLRCVLSYRRPPQLWRYTGLLKRKLAHVDEVIAMSEFSRKKHAEFGLGRDMEVLPYFLPENAPPAEAPREGPRFSERPYFLFVGRLEKIKGLDDVLPVMDRFPHCDLLIAGDGEYGETLRGIAGERPNIRFLGRLDQEALARAYRDAVALIVPSVCFETFGIILIEAFRQRTPVIARRLGPFPEIVEASGAGELFEDEGELVRAMERLEGDPERRARCAAAGHEAWRTRWSESAVIPRYLEIVRRCAEKKGRSRVLEILGSERVA